MKKKRILGALVLAMVFVAGLIGMNGFARAAEFRPMITIINSKAPDVEPVGDYTGDVGWATGANYVPGMTLEFALEIDYDLRLFKTVKVDGNELRLNVDYYLEEGSTVIVFSTDYLDTLAPGTHNVEVLFTNGMTFASSFVISDDPNMVVPNTGSQYIKDAEGGSANVGVLLIVLSVVVVVGAVIVRVVREKRFGKENLRSRLMSMCSKLMDMWRVLFSKIKNFCIEKADALRYGWVERQFRFTTKSVIPLGAVAVLVMILFGFGLVRILSSEGEVTATLVEEPESLAIRTSESDYNAEADLANGNKFLYTSQDVTVEAPTRGGYKLFIQTNSDKWNDLSINGSVQADERITAGTGTASTPVKLEADEWGYATEGGVFGSDYTPSTTSLWAGVPVYGSGALLKSVDGATSANSTTKVYYGFNVTNNLPDGKYWGTENNAVIYVAVANVLPDYPIVYDCNGGTGSIADQAKPADGSIQLSDGTGCVKGDASIVAWNTNRAGTGQSFAKGDIYEGNEGLYLYAIWDDVPASDLPAKPKYTYKLSYDLNGGVAVNPDDFAVVTSDETEDDTYMFTLASSEPTREGYAFQGWSRGSVCITIGECSNGDVYSAGASVRVTKVDTVMHAVWKDNATGEIPLVDGLNYTYVLHYDARGGSGSTDITFADVKMDTVEFPVNVTPVMEGYQFNGWYNPSTGLTIMPADTAKLTVDKLETTLYAIWAKEYAYILNYDANGGAGAPAQQIVTSAASTVSFQISSTVPTRDGYEFLGWTKVKIDQTTTDKEVQGYAPGSILNDVTAAKTTLYAAWNKTAIKVSSISVSKSNDFIYYNAPPKESNDTEAINTIKLTATVQPSNADNKSVEMTSLNNNIATVNSSTGVVTGVDAGEATIRVKAKDGSGKYTDVKVKVYKDIMIMIGSTTVRDFEKNVPEDYSTYHFSVNDGTLVYIYKSAGANAEWQYSYSGGLKKVRDILDKYRGKDEYVRFYIHFPMTGNTIADLACKTSEDMAVLRETAADHSDGFKHAIDSLRQEYGLNRIYGVVSSIPLLRPGQVPSGRKSIVKVGDPNACSKGYRSNEKYYKFNKYLNSDGFFDGDKLVFVPMFSKYMNTPGSVNGDMSKVELKEEYKNKDPYQTTDGSHMTEKTAKDYIKKLFKNTLEKIPVPYFNMF